MANFQTHVGTAAVLGVAYGAAGALLWQYDWGVVLLATGLTMLGGMLPDLDSDSGRPVRELSTLAAFIFPILFIPRLRHWGLTIEQGFVIIIGANLLIRYGLAAIIRRISVHRGMFHSLPALAISGLAVFLVYHNDNYMERYYLAGSVMIGFLSHLVLDELYAVNFNGIIFKFNKFAGSAIKFYSSSWKANLITYGLLFGLGWMAWETIGNYDPDAPIATNERRFFNSKRGGGGGGDRVYRQVIRPGGN